jgi:hypothetical protein
MKDSEKHINQLKNSIREISDNIDGLYNTLYQEIRKDVLKAEDKKEKILKETNDIYDQLTEDECIKLIKSRLPLRIKLLNKITYCGKAIYEDKYISIRFSFGDYYDFYYDFYIQDIKRILHIKTEDDKLNEIAEKEVKRIISELKNK